MTTTAKSLVSGSQLTAAADTYYTAPASTKAVIRSATLCNTTAGTVACTVYLVPNGGTAGASNTVISARSIVAGATDNCAELVNKVLEAGGTIQAQGLNVTLVASGMEIT